MSEPVQDAVRLAPAACRPTVVPEQVQPLSKPSKDELAASSASTGRRASCPIAPHELDDELAAGSPLETGSREARDHPLKLERIDHTGHTPAHERLAADRLTSEILIAVFAAAQGDTSLLEQTADGRYFMFRVDAVEPAHERPLAEVRDEVTRRGRPKSSRIAPMPAPRSCDRR